MSSTTIPADWTPTARFTAGVDTTQWAGAGNLMSRGGSNLTISTGVIYRDALAFLNGYGTIKAGSLPGSLGQVGTGVGTWAITITSDNKIQITNDTDTFVVSANADYGFTSDSASATTATADADFDRGVITSHLTITPTSSAAFQIPDFDGIGTPTAFRSPSMVTLMRERGFENDADDNHISDCLAALISTQLCAGGLVDVGFTSAGLVEISYPTGGSDITFANTSFQQWLGFNTSTPTVVTSGGVDIITADYQPTFAWTPTRPLTMCERIEVERGAVTEDDSGNISAVNFGSAHRWAVNVYAGGPASPEDEELHVRRFFRAVKPGYPITLFRDVNEPRRRVEPPYGVYSTLETPEYRGERGRVDGYLNAPGDREMRTVWNGDVRMRYPVELIINERSD